MIRFISPREAAELTPFAYKTVWRMCVAGDPLVRGAKFEKGRWCIPETAPLFQPAPDPDVLPPDATLQERVVHFRRFKHDPETLIGRYAR